MHWNPLHELKILPALILYLSGFQLAAENKEVYRLDHAEALFKQGEVSSAKKELQGYLGLHPASLQGLVLLTKLFLTEDDYDKAAQQIQLALKQSPSHAGALATYGHCLFRDGDFAAADAHFRKSLQIDSKQADAYLGLGRLYLTKQQLDESLEAFQKAIHLAPEQEDNYFFASEAYGAKKDYSKQIESLEKYLSLKPRSDEERVRNAEALLIFFRSFEKQQVARIVNSSLSYEIPFQPFYGLMIVEGRVNGEGPFRFLVDSGATSTVLSNSLIEELKIPIISTAVVKCVGGTGKTGARLCKAEKLKIGELEIQNLPVSSFDNTIFAGLMDGVLSTADLADFLITLDYPDQKIQLNPWSRAKVIKSSVKASPDVIQSDFRILGNLILVPIAINRQNVRNFLFDTGAVTSVLSKRQAAVLGVREDSPNATVDIQFAGACGVTQSVLSVERVDLGLAKFKMDFAQILAVDLKEISKEMRTEVSGILGADFYSKRKVILDYRDLRLTIE